MGFFSSFADKILGVNPPKAAPAQPAITADDIVASAIAQGVLQPPTTPVMEPIPMATFEGLWPEPETPVTVQMAGGQVEPVRFPWWILGLGALWFWEKKKR